MKSYLFVIISSVFIMVTSFSCDKMNAADNADNQIDSKDAIVLTNNPDENHQIPELSPKNDKDIIENDDNSTELTPQNPELSPKNDKDIIENDDNSTELIPQNSELLPQNDKDIIENDDNSSNDKNSKTSVKPKRHVCTKNSCRIKDSKIELCDGHTWKNISVGSCKNGKYIPVECYKNECVKINNNLIRYCRNGEWHITQEGMCINYKYTKMVDNFD